MAEDFADHRRIFDEAALRRGSGQAMIFKVPPKLGQCSVGQDLSLDDLTVAHWPLARALTS